MTIANISPTEIADSQELETVAEVERADPLLELGTSGLQRAAGYIDEEFLPHLKGRKAAQVYREMGDNDPITGALLFSIFQLLRGIDWSVSPGGKSAQDAKNAKLVETSMHDMSDTWDETLMEIFSCIQYGWAWNEIVLKSCHGPKQQDGRLRSKFDDGMVRWRRLPLRPQDSLQRWVFDDDSNVRAMVQQAPPDYKQRIIPISKSLLFRFGHAKNNPEGRSALRTSYRPWYYKKRLEEFESIGVERDLAGLPVVSVPAEYMRARPGSDSYKMVEALKRMVRSVRRNEQEGVVFPVSYDQETNQPLFKFELMSSGGARQHDTDALIRRYEERQLMTVLADFILVGHQTTGTYNLHVDKTGIFREALNATANSMAEIFNRYAIPRLMEANRIRTETPPTIVPSNVDAPDLAQLGQFLTATAGLGFVWGPDVEMEKYLRRAAGLPKLPDSTEAEHKRAARVDEAARMAEQQARLLAARSQLAQAVAAEQQAATGQHTPETMAMQQQAEQGQMQAQTGQQQQQQAVVDDQRAGETHAVDIKERQQAMKQAAAKPPAKKSAAKPKGKS